VSGTKSENPMPSGISDSTLPDIFADDFMNKISKIRDSLHEFNKYKPINKSVQVLDEFKELSQDEVKLLICELNTKSCELDILPTHVLKQYLTHLLPTFSKLENLSLTQGVFPSRWKQAIVRPLLKKCWLELTYSNYRPVSNLSFLSKLIEKAVLLRLNHHASQHNLLPKNQSAYRQNHSCESALLRLVNDLLCDMEHQEVTALIAINLSAAFDTVDHEILLDVVKQQYGVSDKALCWIGSYLNERTCVVSVNSSLSNPHPLECSVPHGSCL
jgi:hypothetical protein